MGDFFISADRLFNWHATGRDFRLFDVRRAQALQPDSRLLPRARWRNHMEVADRSTSFDRNTPVIVNCMHGHNVSQIAGLKLRELGFTAYVLEGGIEGWIAAGRPTAGQNRLAPVEAQAPSQWVTRLGAKIDRIACPWLIRRFIDPDAVFRFAETEWVLDIADEIGAVAFDTPGAPIEHDGELCSFDTLLNTFAIKDSALEILATIVRGADTDRNDLAPEAAGLLAVSLGNAARAENDHQALQFGMPVYDALYARLCLAAGETHGWQPMAS